MLLFLAGVAAGVFLTIIGSAVALFALDRRLNGPVTSDEWPGWSRGVEDRP